MQVEIWSDVVCPWCYVGVTRFERVLADAGADDVEVVHRSFELDPSPGPGTRPLREALVDKFGIGPDEVAHLEDRVASVARADGLAYTSDRLHGGTFDVHRVIHLAAARGRQREVVDALYAAHFSGAAAILEREGLVAVAESAGLDGDEVRAVLAGDAYADAVRADERTAAQLGVRGVPFFVLDGRLGLSGAQPAEVMAAALDQARATAGAPAGEP